MDATSTDRPADAEKPASFDRPRWVVGIGAGAGGLEAIQLLFGAMPADADVAFIICRRVQAGLSDPLADLLCTQTSMPVVAAGNGTPVEAGRIYLVAPDARMILLKDRLVRFTDDEASDGDPDVDDAISPIDMLLHSLAVSVGPKAIAVMLSGNDDDGLRGCASIREYGGRVLVQHPESTEFDAMPRRVIEADLASAVGPPGALPDLIWRHVSRGRSPVERGQRTRGRDEEALARITALLEARFAVDPHAYRPSLVAKRVRRRLAMAEAATLADYAARLADDDHELRALHDDLLIRVTTFFRDPEAFAVLEREVAPILVERMAPDRPIRVWVPACASGEEAYSLGMLLLDRIEQAGKTPHLEILASDRHASTLKQARAGRYGRERIDGAPQDLVARYLHSRAADVDVGPELRRHVTFVDHDMLKAPPPDDIDLVSCRNLLIYLAAASREKALLACCEALRPDGFLFLGPSEQPWPQVTDLETVHGKWRIYRKAPPPTPPVDDALARLSDSRKQAPTEALIPKSTCVPTEKAAPATQGPNAQAKARPPKLAPESYLGGVMVENQRMLESTIDTLLASNDSLRRRNRDLRAENQQLTHAHAALDDIATMIAHDLKAPLRKVDRLAERLKATLLEHESGETALKSLRPIQHQLIILNRLIDDLLIYARQGPSDPAGLQDIDLGDLLRETLTLIGLPKGVQVMMRPQSLRVSTWRIPLACIFRNLLGQAIARIGEASGRIRIDAGLKDQLLEIAIADDGRTTGRRPNELGLAIARQLLDAAGGRFASSETGDGAGNRVMFTWPIELAAAGSEAAMSPSA